MDSITPMEKAVRWAVGIAQDNTHGYSQDSRWGPEYDCSSLVISAWEHAGVLVKQFGAGSTYNMRNAFIDAGFTVVYDRRNGISKEGIDISNGSGLVMGDVLLREPIEGVASGHVEMVTGTDGGLLYVVGASWDYDGKRGDSKGNEIRKRTYFNESDKPWQYVLRYGSNYSFGYEDIRKEDCISHDKYITSRDEMLVNAKYIYNYFIKRGWTPQAICGMLGNMERESTLNPGLEAYGSSTDFGLVQWSPGKDMRKWLNDHDFEDGDIEGQCLRIEKEFNNEITQYSPNAIYAKLATTADYKMSTLSPYYLACAFAWNYERSAVVLYGANSKKEAAKLTEEEKEANREALRKARGDAAIYWFNKLANMRLSNYIPRFYDEKTDTLPAIVDNQFWYSKGTTQYYSGNLHLPNCTCYAWGRFWEISGISNEPHRGSLHGNGEEWFVNAINAGHYETGQEPRLGAIICWQKGKVGNTSDGYGHVAIVEDIKCRYNQDGSREIVKIVISESIYVGKIFFRTKEIPYAGGKFTYGSGYTFQGFIYNPYVILDTIPQISLIEQISPKTVRVTLAIPGMMYTNSLKCYYKWGSDDVSTEDPYYLLSKEQEVLEKDEHAVEKKLITEDDLSFKGAYYALTFEMPKVRLSEKISMVIYSMDDTNTEYTGATARISMTRSYPCFWVNNNGVINNTIPYVKYDGKKCMALPVIRHGDSLYIIYNTDAEKIIKE